MKKYFLVKIKVETLTEKGKIKKVSESYLVKSDDVKDAEKRFMEEMKSSMETFEISSISETKILDVF